MSLTCECPHGDIDDTAWWYYQPQGYSTMPLAPRRKRCCSCHEKIEHGAVVLEFYRSRGPRNEIEERIHGEYGDIALATWFHCEKCADLYLSLNDLGFCVELADSMPDLLEQYHENYPPKRREL